MKHGGLTSHIKYNEYYSVDELDTAPSFFTTYMNKRNWFNDYKEDEGFVDEQDSPQAAQYDEIVRAFSKLQTRINDDVVSYATAQVTQSRQPAQPAPTASVSDSINTERLIEV